MGKKRKDVKSQKSHARRKRATARGQSRQQRGFFAIFEGFGVLARGRQPKSGQGAILSR